MKLFRKIFSVDDYLARQSAGYKGGVPRTNPVVHVPTNKKGKHQQNMADEKKVLGWFKSNKSQKPVSYKVGKK